MANARTQEQDELEQLRNRLDWMEEERLKNGKRLVQIEQRLQARERELDSQELRVKELEEKIAQMSLQVNRISNVDSQMELYKDEMVKLIEQYDKRRVEGDKELDNLRRIEHEMHQREISALGKEIPRIGRLENDMKMRESEDARLSKLTGNLQNNIPALKSEIGNWKQGLKFVEEAERSNTALIAEIQTSLLERVKKADAVESRLDITNHSLSKIQSTTQELADDVSELKITIKDWSDQIQVSEHHRNKRLEDWQVVLDDFQGQIDGFSSEWVKYAEQYKEAKGAVQAMAEWQERIEIGQRETAELTRIELNQMRSRWDNFTLENDKHWKNFEVEHDQRWSGAERREGQIRATLNELSELIEEIQQDKDTLWRVQTAQADAMKKWPRILLEEVEKAKAHNPDSRRQPALIPVRED
jgi:chromosome segregation ATPase